MSSALSVLDNVDPSEEEVLRKQLKPNPSNEDILNILYTTYPQLKNRVSVIKELESYDDKNILVELEEEGKKKKCLVKIYNGVESAKYTQAELLKKQQEEESSSSSKEALSLSSIHLYEAIFSHLRQPSFGVNTSSPLILKNDTAGNGRSIHQLSVTSAARSPAPLVLQLLNWVEGSTMASTATIPIETLAEAGLYLGKVCHGLDALSLNEVARKTADRYHAWDGKNTLDLEKFLYCITDDGRRNLVKSVLVSFRKELMDDNNPEKPDFRMGITQGDFNDANIILDSENRVSGVIDFGDTTLSWRVLDISIAMTYAMISNYGKSNRAISAAAAILRGFHSIYPLTSIEQKHLRLLVASRLSCSATLGAYSYQQNPENKYLLLHAEPAWKTLELVWGNGNGKSMSAAIDDMFRIACEGAPDSAGGNKGDKPVIDCTDISFPDPSVVDVLQSVRVKGPYISEPAQKKQKSSDGAVSDLPEITFVTGNKKKLEEVKRILSSSGAGNSSSSDIPFDISNKKIDLPELQGDPSEIAREKCSIAAKEVGGAVITEDTSLCFNALQGMPGPYIKWFLEKCGHDGLNNLLAFSEDKSGYAQTVVGFCPGPGKDVIIFDGRTKGKVVPARGPLDFGWDPIFQPDEGGGLTYAEMAKESKDAISHRSRSFQKLRGYLIQNADIIKKDIN